MIITIDGPAGSGKSTIAKLLAKKYNFTYLDTGAMYRMIALYTLENSLNLKNENDIENILSNTKLDIIQNKFFLNGIDVSEKIRTPEVTNVVSEVATIKKIREKLVFLQREISEGKDVILDGRDIGTIVFPKAELKIFLIASPEERAKRRLGEYRRKNLNITYDEVLENIKKRDFIDSTREESPLKKAEDAIEIDSSNISIEGVVSEISRYIDKIKE